MGWKLDWVFVKLSCCDCCAGKFEIVSCIRREFSIQTIYTMYNKIQFLTLEEMQRILFHFLKNMLLRLN